MPHLALDRSQTGRVLDMNPIVLLLQACNAAGLERDELALNRWWIPKCDNGIGIQNQKIKLKTSFYGVGLGWILSKGKGRPSKASRPACWHLHGLTPHLVHQTARVHACGMADQFDRQVTTSSRSKLGAPTHAKIQVPPKPKILKSRP